MTCGKDERDKSRERVIAWMEKWPEGGTVEQISKALDISAPAVDGICAKLQDEGMLRRLAWSVPRLYFRSIVLTEMGWFQLPVNESRLQRIINLLFERFPAKAKLKTIVKRTNVDEAHLVPLLDHLVQQGRVSYFGRRADEQRRKSCWRLDYKLWLTMEADRVGANNEAPAAVQEAVPVPV